MHCFRSKLRAIVTLSATVWMISTPAAHAHPRSSFNPFILKEPAEKIRAIFPEPVEQARAPSNFALQGSQRLLSKIASMDAIFESSRWEPCSAKFEGARACSTGSGNIARIFSAGSFKIKGLKLERGWACAAGVEIIHTVADSVTMARNFERKQCMNDKTVKSLHHITKFYIC